MSTTDDAINPQEILGLLYDAADVGMCVTDSNRRFVTVNRAYTNTYGYAEEELVGKEFTMVLPEGEREDAAKTHDDFLSGNSDETAGEWRVQRKDGTIRDVLVTAGRLVTEDGSRYKVTTVYDITDRKLRHRKLESELEKRELLLREVHHRVKNNLNSLESMMQLQLRSKAQDSNIADVLTESINRIKTMSNLYDRLNHSRNLRVVDLQDYLSGLVDDLVATAPDSDRVTIDADIQAATTSIDNAISLGLVANELITNSLKHSAGEAGSVWIGVRLATDDNTFTLEVEDRGPGVSPSFLTEERTSLGIQLVQAVVEQHQGTLELVAPERSLFRVILPRED